MGRIDEEEGLMKVNKYIYLYALTETQQIKEQSLTTLDGFDSSEKLYTIIIDEITAIVCDLDAKEYAEESINNKIESDKEWLQTKAFHHHETLLKLFSLFQVIPLKFCTIYENEESLKEKIKSNEEDLMETFKWLKGNEEWNLKIYCDDDQLKQNVVKHNATVEAKRQEISTLTPGKQYFEKKKMDKLVEVEVENEKEKICHSLHENLKQYAEEASIKKNWSQNATGRKEQMAWNSVFLIPKSRVNHYLKEVAKIEENLTTDGWRIEATGPWPPYHYSRFS